jgi:CDP-diglyceride synthetase
MSASLLYLHVAVSTPSGNATIFPLIGTFMFFISWLAFVWYGSYHTVIMVRVCNHDVWECLRFILFTKIFKSTWTHVLCFMYCILTVTLQSSDWNFLHWVLQLWCTMCLTSWNTILTMCTAWQLSNTGTYLTFLTFLTFSYINKTRNKALK